MISLTRFQIAFTPSIRMSILTLLSVCLFISLGIWQLKRADEKKGLLMQASRAEKSPSTLWTPERPLPTQYQPLEVEGHFSKKIIFLDNQHENHSFGYHVFSPLILNNGHVVIIDRGWVSKAESQVIETPLDPIKLNGSAYYPSKKQWILGEAIEIKTENQAVIEIIDVQLISQFLHKSVYPFIIRLNTQSPYGYVRHWTTVNMPPRRHVAYAFQWFMIAGVIFIIFMVLNLKYDIKKT